MRIFLVGFLLLPVAINAAFPTNYTAMVTNDVLYLNNAKIQIGPNPTRSSDSWFTLGRNVDNTIAGNGHAFSDSSVITRGGGSAYASFDGRFLVSGTGSYDHFVPFQAGLTYSSSGSVSDIYGLFEVLTMTAGSLGNHYGVWINNPVLSGGATILNNYGLYVGAQTAGSVNWSVFCAGSAPSYFGGTIYAHSFGSQIRLTVDGTVANDGALIAGATGIGLGNWNLDRGFLIKPNGNIDVLGSLDTSGHITVLNGLTVGETNTAAYAGRVRIGGSQYPQVLLVPSTGSTINAQIYQDADNLNIAAQGNANTITIVPATGKITSAGSITALQGVSVGSTNNPGYAGRVLIGGVAYPDIVMSPSSGATVNAQIFQEGNILKFGRQGSLALAELDLSTGNLKISGSYAVASQVGITTTNDVLVAGGTTNRTVYVGGILVSNIPNFY